ncbi:MAG: bile acid:sodium symporter family protein [Treponema sp.]|nr:bile acid:sodium symporter family protein [Treponema sp.]
MTALNGQLERIMPVLTPAGVFLGFLFPQVFIYLRPLVSWLFAVMTLSGALKLRARELGMALRRPLPILLFFLASHILLPLAVLVISGLLFSGDSDTISGYILVYAAPTAVSGFIWTSIYRGDAALTLAIILLDTLVAPALVPGTVSLLLGTKSALDMTGIAVSVILMVVVPTIIGVTVNEASRGKIPRLVVPYLNPAAKACIILVIAANASAVAPQVHLEDPKVWAIGALCLGFAALGYLFAKLICILGRLNPEKRVSIFFAVGLRNISAATTIAIEFFPEAAALPAILGIVFQQTMAAVMGKLLMRPAGGNGADPPG